MSNVTYIGRHWDLSSLRRLIVICHARPRLVRDSVDWKDQTMGPRLDYGFAREGQRHACNLSDATGPSNILAVDVRQAGPQRPPAQLREAFLKSKQQLHSVCWRMAPPSAHLLCHDDAICVSCVSCMLRLPESQVASCTATDRSDARQLAPATRRKAKRHGIVNRDSR